MQQQDLYPHPHGTRTRDPFGYPIPVFLPTQECVWCRCGGLIFGRLHLAVLVVDALVHSTYFIVRLPTLDLITCCLPVACGHSLVLSARTHVMRRPYWLHGFQLVSWWLELYWGFLVSTTLSSCGVGPLAGVARLTPSVVLAVVTVPGPLSAAAASSSTLPRDVAPFSPTLALISTFPWSVVVRSRSRRVPLLRELF